MNSRGLIVRTGTILLKGCIELLLVLPVLLTAAVYLIPESLGLLWIITLPLGYGAGYMLNHLLSMRRAYLQLIASVCLAAMYSYGLFGSSYVAIVSLLVSFITVYRGIRLVWIPWDIYFPVNFYVFGLILYFISSVVLHFVESFEPYMPYLLWGGLVSLIITLFAANESNMKQETLSGDKEPVIAAEMMWQNRLLVMLILAVILLVVLFRQLGEAVMWLLYQSLHWLQALFSGSAEQPVPETPKAPPKVPMNLSGSEEPALWLVWLQKIMYFVVGGLVVLGCLLAVYLVLRRVPRLFRLLLSWLAGKLHSEGKRTSKIGYEDDVESLMDWEALNDKLLSGWKRMFAGSGREKWEDLQDNKQRIRYLYRNWLRQSMRRGYLFKSFLTPRETGSEVEQWSGKEISSADALLNLYEQARYGDKPVTDEELTMAKQWADKKK
ncbi:hypothetical protein GCM10023310_66610 [Paenibacillus vulneris]|uniref:DUF4129 domain-containing protein n=1 Tax=Paenibacillus vulneris TaxID=1133364 RepID=A0ABW3UK22_9BACL